MMMKSKVSNNQNLPQVTKFCQFLKFLVNLKVPKNNIKGQHIEYSSFSRENLPQLQKWKSTCEL